MKKCLISVGIEKPPRFIPWRHIGEKPSSEIGRYANLCFVNALLETFSKSLRMMFSIFLLNFKVSLSPFISHTNCKLRA